MTSLQVSSARTRGWWVDSVSANANAEPAFVDSQPEVVVTTLDVLSKELISNGIKANMDNHNKRIYLVSQCS
jgi:hypothetical protein